MAGASLTAAQVLALEQEFLKLQAEEGLSGLGQVLKLSEVALKMTGQCEEGLGAKETIERARGVLRDFFGALRASADLTRELGPDAEASPPASSEK